MTPAPTPRPSPNILPTVGDLEKGARERVGMFLLAVMKWKVGSDEPERLGSEGHFVRNCDCDHSDHPGVKVSVVR